MKGICKKLKPLPTAPRQLQLHGRFSPGIPDLKDTALFLEFLAAAQERLSALSSKKLRRKKLEFSKFKKSSDAVRPIFAQTFRDELTPAEAAARIKHLVPDAKLRRKVFDFWSDVSPTTPEQLEKAKQKVAVEVAALANAEKIFKARGAMAEATEQLNELAMTGDAEAAKALIQSVIVAGLALGLLEVAQPEMIGRIARVETTWPLLTDGKSGWERKAAQKIARLDLGADLAHLRTRFRQPRGAEINLPARTWAKAAVRTIEVTRWRFLTFGKLSKEFGSVEALSDFCFETGWEFGQSAGWEGEVMGLGRFSVETLPFWKRAIRKIIRQQMPDFQTRPEWATQRHSAIALGRSTPGEIQTAILDDIASALEGLAPPLELPKPAC